MWRILVAVLFSTNLLCAEGDQSEQKADSGKLVVRAEEKYEITIDTSETPDLRAWAEQQLAPAVKQWYPKLVKMLPSEGYEAPEQVTITFSKEMRGVAAAGGNHIRCAAQWFRENLQGMKNATLPHSPDQLTSPHALLHRREEPRTSATLGRMP